MADFFMNMIPQPKVLKLEENVKLRNFISDYKIKCSRWHKLVPVLGRSGLIGKNGRLLKIVSDKTLSKTDEYEIVFKENEITVRASSEKSAFYAICTLKQLKQRYGLSYTGRISDWADLEMRILMVDLKRLGWNFDYLLGVIERAAEMKINYILMEYEDKIKFDFCDRIPVKSAFTKEQIKKINEKAGEYFTEIIPLVQCLAHYEYILKYDKYKDLRENPLLSSQACPLKPGTFELFKKMAGEVMELHPDSKYFHVGADEPFLLGTCPDCAKVKNERGNGKLYSDYVNKVFRWVEENNKTPLFWGDIICRYKDAAKNCSKKAVAVDWNYTSKKTREKTVTYHRDGILYLDYKVYDKMTPSQKKEIDKDHETDHRRKDFLSLPHGRFFKTQGFEVLGGSHVASVDNILTHSENAMINGFKGNLATYWASANSCALPYTIYESRWSGACMLAASAWNMKYEKKNRKTFFERAFNNSLAADLYKVFDGRSFVIPGNNEGNNYSFLNKISKKSSCHINGLASHEKLIALLFEKIFIEKELATLRKKELAKPLLKSDCYKFIDITDKCNSRFTDDEKSPGWTGEGLNDERFFPQGKRCFNGVPFHIIKETPDNKTVIFFGDAPAKNSTFKNSIENIAINEKVYALNFLHTITIGNVSSENTVAHYIINYESGDKETIPIKPLDNIGGWWNIQDMPSAPVAKAVKNLFSMHMVGFHTYSYKVKYPSRKIESIDLVCDSKLILLGVAAITATLSGGIKKDHNNKAVMCIKKLIKKTVTVCKTLEEVLPEYLHKDSVREVSRIVRNTILNYMERKLRFLS